MKVCDVCKDRMPASYQIDLRDIADDKYEYITQIDLCDAHYGAIGQIIEKYQKEKRK